MPYLHDYPTRSEFVFETVFGQCRKYPESLVDHRLKTMRQMVAVTSMDDHAFHAFAVKLAGGWASAMVLA